MLWYGLTNKYKKLLVKKLKKKTNIHLIKYKWEKNLKIQMNKQTFFVYKPKQWNSILFQNIQKNSYVILFFSEIYFFKLSIPNKFVQLKYDSNTSVYIVHTLYIHNYYRMFFAHLNQVFNVFYRPVFKKIKFKGKGYYIYKNKRNTITPQFGYSHRLYLYSYFASVKFLSKTSIFIFGLVKTDVLRTGFGVKAMRPINVFTGRGVRFSREVIYKKVGKVSSYR